VWTWPDVQKKLEAVAMATALPTVVEVRTWFGVATAPAKPSRTASV
jgi:hypothetical protein